MRSFIKQCIVTVTALSLVLPSAYASFSDVVPQSLFYDAVEYFSYEKPIIALDKEEFRPLDEINKAEFFKLMIASGGEVIPTKIDAMPFSDVPSDTWFAPYIKHALDLNIVQYSSYDPYFRPNEIVSRAEGISLILDYYEINSDIVSDISTDYFDVHATDHFASESQIAYMLQLLSDHKSRYYKPEKTLTRAETIHILYKLHKAGFVNTTITQDTSLIKEEESYELFLDVYNTISEEYIDKDSIHNNDLIYGAISGMVMSLSDPYSTFFTPQDAKRFQESLSGTFDGIGIYIVYEDGNYIIQTPLEGSPAKKAGLKANDIITHIDGTITNGITFDNIIEMLRGESGTQVTLTIERNNVQKDYTLTREYIDIPFVESEIRNNIGIINYYQFTGNSHYQFTEELKKLLDKNVAGLVLDLRNNPGGYLYSSQQMISRFIPKGEPFVTMKLANNYSYNEVSQGPGDLSSLPVVIIINEGTASAAEIVALALQEQNNATIVGAQSFGKAKIQEVISYRDGSSLKLSIAKWTSPKGVSVENTGVIPDTVINDETDQLLEAISLAAHL